MSATVRRVLTKLVPPALTANNEEEPSDSYHIQRVTSPTSTSEHSASDNDYASKDKKSKRGSIISSIRKKTARGLSPANGHANEKPNVPNGDTPNGPLARPNTQNRRMSMTEMKEGRHSERKAKEQAAAEERKRKHRQAWENVNTKYLFAVLLLTRVYSRILLNTTTATCLSTSPKHR